MIELQKQYTVEEIGQDQYDNIEEYNRVLTTLKTLVKSLLDNGNDAEDIAKMCWHCGCEYASPEETPSLMADLVDWYNKAEQEGKLKL